MEMRSERKEEGKIKSCSDLEGMEVDGKNEWASQAKSGATC